MAEINSDEFESGDKTGFDGSHTAGSNIDTDTVQSTVKDTGTYSWECDLAQPGDWEGDCVYCYFDQSSWPAGNILWLKARMRIDTLDNQFGNYHAIMGLWSSDNAPWYDCVSLLIDPSAGAQDIGVGIMEADSTWTTAFGTQDFGVGDSSFHTLKMKIDNSGSDPIVTAWYDATECLSNTFTGVTIPSFQRAYFSGIWMASPRNWGNQEREGFIDKCDVWDSDPDAAAVSDPAAWIAVHRIRPRNTLLRMAQRAMLNLKKGFTLSRQEWRALDRVMVLLESENGVARAMKWERWPVAA